MFHIREITIQNLTRGATMLPSSLQMPGGHIKRDHNRFLLHTF